MELEIQKQDFKSIEEMETNIHLQKSEVCLLQYL